MRRIARQPAHLQEIIINIRDNTSDPLLKTESLVSFCVKPACRS